MERHILRQETSSCPITSSWNQWVPTLTHPCKPYLQWRQRRPWSAAYPWLDYRFWLDSLSKSDRMVLISRGLPSGYTPARQAYPDALPSPCLLIGTWQFVKAHRITRDKPKIYVSSHYITFVKHAYLTKNQWITQ